MKGIIFVGTSKMITIECCSCHVMFAVTKYFYDECQRKKPDKSFFCPNGHEQHFVGVSDENRLREQLLNVQSCCDRYREKADKLAETIPRIRGGYRAQLKRLRGAA